MAKLDDTPLWSDVYQLEQTDPVIGGTPNPATGAGMDNIPHLQLAQRTSWLKEAVDTLVTTVVAASTTVAGLVKLSTATNSTSTTTAATPSAVKAVNDNAETRALKSTTLTAGDGLSGGGTLGGNRTLAVDGSVVRTARSVTGAGLATGGGDLSADRTITVPDATQAEAEAGTITSKAMSPLRVAQAIAATIASYVPATRTIGTGDGLTGGGNLSANRSLAVDGTVVRTTRSLSAGGLATGGGALSADRTITVPAATQAEAEAGTSTSKAMTPKGVAQAMAQFGIVDGNCPQADNLDTLTLNGFFRTSNTTIGAPDIGSSYDAVGIAINGAGQKTQIMSLSKDLMCMRVDDGSCWGDWLTLLHGGPVAGSNTGALDQRLASQAEATAGNSNDKLMTPLRTKQALDAGVMSRIAQASAGAVGTYAILMRSAADGGSALVYGTIYPGSQLKPQGFGRANDTVLFATAATVPSMAGSWRCLGEQPHTSSTAGLALFVRIA